MSFLWLSGSFRIINPVTRPAKSAARIISACKFTVPTLSGATGRAFYTVSTLTAFHLRVISLTAPFADHVAWSWPVLFCVLFVYLCAVCVLSPCADFRTHPNVPWVPVCVLKACYFCVHIYTFAHSSLHTVLILRKWPLISAKRKKRHTPLNIILTTINSSSFFTRGILGHTRPRTGHA